MARAAVGTLARSAVAPTLHPVLDVAVQAARRRCFVLGHYRGRDGEIIRLTTAAVSAMWWIPTRRARRWFVANCA